MHARRYWAAGWEWGRRTGRGNKWRGRLRDSVPSDGQSRTRCDAVSTQSPPHCTGQWQERKGGYLRAHAPPDMEAQGHLRWLGVSLVPGIPKGTERKITLSWNNIEVKTQRIHTTVIHSKATLIQDDVHYVKLKTWKRGRLHEVRPKSYTILLYFVMQRELYTHNEHYSKTKCERVWNIMRVWRHLLMAGNLSVRTKKMFWDTAKIHTLESRVYNVCIVYSVQYVIWDRTTQLYSWQIMGKIAIMGYRSKQWAALHPPISSSLMN